MTEMRRRAGQESPRILLVSQRLRYPTLARSLRHEFEDRACELDFVELLAPPGPPRRWALIHRASAALELLSTGSSAWLSFPPRRHRAAYDLVLVVVQTTADLLRLEPLASLLRLGRASACLVDDIFVHSFGHRTGEIRLLRQFDQLFLTVEGSVEAVGAWTGRPTQFLPPSVDALQLCPPSLGAPRKVDVYAIGRYSPSTHQALLDHCEQNRWLYLYDQGSADMVVPDHREHRLRVGNLLRQARYFLCYPGKIDHPEEIGRQQEIGFRYFEGAAAGALLIGQAPNSPSFPRLFDWEDPVLPLPFGASEIARHLEPLESDPERAERIRRSGVLGALRQHDHVHRWAEILVRMGLPETPAMVERRRSLEVRAGTLRAERVSTLELGSQPGASTRSSQHSRQ